MFINFGITGRLCNVLQPNCFFFIKLLFVEYLIKSVNTYGIYIHINTYGINKCKIYSYLMKPKGFT